MKRILLVSPFPPYIGGVSVSVERLRNYLLMQGYKVEKFDIHYSNATLNRSEVLKTLRYLSLPFFILKKGHFDIVHFHVSGIIPKLYVRLWRHLFPRSTLFIATIHGQADHILNSRLGPFALEGFDRLICVKSGDVQNMPAVLKARSVEIPAFIPPDTSSPVGGIPGYVDMFLAGPGFKILVNGFIIPVSKEDDLYGFSTAVRLLERLNAANRNTLLAAIVQGKEKSSRASAYLEKLKERCKEKGISNRVCWAEGEQMELWPLLGRINVLLRPTRSDGDALSVREAMYMNVPVVASDAVPRPQNVITYRLDSDDDLFRKMESLIDNNRSFVLSTGNSNEDFAKMIMEQYEAK